VATTATANVAQIKMMAVKMRGHSRPLSGTNNARTFSVLFSVPLRAIPYSLAPFCSVLGGEPESVDVHEVPISQGFSALLARELKLRSHHAGVLHEANGRAHSGTDEAQLM
jgi:hypothetical protein